MTIIFAQEAHFLTQRQLSASMTKICLKSYMALSQSLWCTVHRSDSRDVMEWCCETAHIPKVCLWGVKQHPVRPSQ